MSDGRTAKALDQKLGARVRDRRLALGMSQERLAELVGVTFQQVQKYEKGVNRIAASRLYDIAVALDVPVATFYDGLGRGRRANKSEKSAEDVLATPGLAELVSLYLSIESKSARRRLIELVRASKNE